jgi:hypothetical protein
MAESASELLPVAEASTLDSLLAANIMAFQAELHEACRQACGNPTMFHCVVRIHAAEARLDTLLRLQRTLAGHQFTAPTASPRLASAPV